MEKINMVDLIGQYEKISEDINSAMQSVIKSGQFIGGNKVNEFTASLQTYLSVKHVVPCANGTDALQIALMALDLPKGSKVICPAFNFIAASEAVALLGYTPVFVDVVEDTFDLNPEQVENAMDEGTKVILPVHLFGQCVNMDAVMTLAKRHDLYVLEDAAQSIGSIYTGKDTQGYSGTMGDIGITSFFPSKNLGCFGDGGALFTNNSSLAEKVRMIAAHGQKKKYFSEVTGINSRLDNLQAAILNEKLKYLDKYNNARKKVAEYYDKAFEPVKEIKVPARRLDSTHVFNQYTIQVSGNKRDKLKAHLHEKGIPAMVYYPIPLHLQKTYMDLGYKGGDFPVAEKLSREVLSLPMHTELSESQLEYISNVIIDFF